MPQWGTNSRKVEARNKIVEQKQEARSKAVKEAEDRYWKDDGTKTQQKQQQRQLQKEEKHHHKLKAAEDKKSLLAMEEEELRNYGKNKKQGKNSGKLTQAQIRQNALINMKMAKKEEQTQKKVAEVSHMDHALQMVEETEIALKQKQQDHRDKILVDAHTLDSALDQLHMDYNDDVTENVMTFKAFYKLKLAEYEEEYPTLKPPQIKDKMFKEYKRKYLRNT